MTPKAEYRGEYNGDSKQTAWEIPDLTIQIVENVVVNRGTGRDSLTGQDAAMTAAYLLGNPQFGYGGMFSLNSYEQGEDGGLLVSSLKLKCLVLQDESDEHYDKVTITDLVTTKVLNLEII